MLNIASGSRATMEAASRVRAGRMVPVETGTGAGTHRTRIVIVMSWCSVQTIL
jgi:hypothetical protein